MKHICGKVNQLETGSIQISTVAILLHDSWWYMMPRGPMPASAPIYVQRESGSMPQDLYGTVLREKIGRLYIRGFFFMY